MPKALPRNIVILPTFRFHPRHSRTAPTMYRIHDLSTLLDLCLHIYYRHVFRTRI